MAGEERMTTPGQLVQVMAEVLGVSKGRVVQHDRELAENGLRSKRGRGTSAAKVTSRDAANLLISLAASASSGAAPKDAVTVCRKYGSFVAVPLDDWQASCSKLGLSLLSELPPEHALRKALAALISSAAKGELSPSSDVQVWVQFLAPEPAAHILCSSDKLGVETHQHYVDVNPAAARRIARQGRFRGDLVTMSTIGLPTLRALGALVADVDR
jgi:hypothetical protein